MSNVLQYLQEHNFAVDLQEMLRGVMVVPGLLAMNYHDCEHLYTCFEVEDRDPPLTPADLQTVYITPSLKSLAVELNKIKTFKVGRLPGVHPFSGVVCHIYEGAVPVRLIATFRSEERDGELWSGTLFALDVIVQECTLP